MENNLQILEDIMKPYFDKKESVEAAPVVLDNKKEELNPENKDLKNDILTRRKELEVELENLRVRSEIEIKEFKTKKEKEIDEYISKSMDSDSNFFTTYGSMLRRDLEKEYDKILEEIERNFKTREEQIISEIKELENVNEEENQNLNKESDFSIDYFRDFTDLKGKSRNQLYEERNRLNLELLHLKPEQELYNETIAELQQCQSEFNEVMNRIQAFEYKYNEQNEPFNSNEFRILYKELNKLSEEKDKLMMILSEKNETIQKIEKINKSLERLEKYLELTELTQEEMFKNNSLNENIIEDIDLVDLEEKNIKNKNENNLSQLPNVDLNNMSVEEDDFELTPVTISVLDTEEEFQNEVSNTYDSKEDKSEIVSYGEEKSEIIVSDDMLHLLKIIYNDVINESRNLKSIKLTASKDVLELPSGEYINEDDINQSVNNLYNKKENRSYIVKERKEINNITKSTIQMFKFKLKEYTAIKLSDYEKISELQGRVNQENFSKKNTGHVQDVNVEEGEYVNRNELIYAIKNLFATKKMYWLDNFKDSKNSYEAYDSSEYGFKYK